MMRTGLCILAVLTGVAVCAQDVAVLEVRGRGIGSGERYAGGGKIKFLSASMGAQVIHYAGEGELGLPLEIDYEVLEPAPIALTTRMGTEYWRLYSFADETMSAVYTGERIELSEPGRHTASAGDTRARLTDRYGPLPSKGLAAIRGHYYFLIDPADGGEWLDVTDPPPFFDQEKVGRDLTFTLADLSGQWDVAVESVQSTWRPGGPVRARITVTDSAGETFPVVNVPAAIVADGRESPLKTEWGALSDPTGWMRGELPPDGAPEQIAISGTLKAMTPEGLEDRAFRATFNRGQGQLSPEEMQIAEQGYELPRNDEGVLRETRAMWVHGDDFTTPEAVENLIDGMTRARMNVIAPIIAVRNNLIARSEIMPRPIEGEDPLARLIELAHRAGLEVHPWFCVTYRDRSFRAWFEQKFGVNVDVVKQDGAVADLPADVHRPEYRDFMVDLMVGVARDYDVDGIHLDYIRAMDQCYCEKCRAEFAEQFGKLLTEATEEDWVTWQREAIGDIVQRTAEGVRRASPDAALSAAVFSSMPGGALQGQDPAGWAREGWIDIVIPMDYQMQSLQLRANERQFLEALDDDDKLVTGLSLYMRSGDEVMSRPPELVSEQIELVRAMGIPGYCLFVFARLNDGQLRMLREQVNTEPAVPYFR